MSIFGTVLRALGFRRARAKEAVVAARPESADLTPADWAVLYYRRQLDSARWRLERAQQALAAGDQSALPRFKKWQARAEEAEKRLAAAKAKVWRHGD